jgi:hypothetical protein
MRISFTLPDSSAAMLERLAQCINEGSQEAVTPEELCRSFVIDILADDAAQHGRLPRTSYTLQ